MPNGAPLILLADDEFAALGVLELLLRAEGFEVVTAADGQEALDIATARSVDLIITDYKMPRMNGAELCSRLQQDPRLSAIPVFMASATYGVQRTLPPGVVAFIPKPIAFPALLTKIRAVLAGGKGLRNAQRAR
jgi:CheY-like chemotaxis protein